jgi:hypothetical protein
MVRAFNVHRSQLISLFGTQYNSFHTLGSLGKSSRGVPDYLFTGNQHPPVDSPPECGGTDGNRRWAQTKRVSNASAARLYWVKNASQMIFCSVRDMPWQYVIKPDAMFVFLLEFTWWWSTWTTISRCLWDPCQAILHRYFLALLPCYIYSYSVSSEKCCAKPFSCVYSTQLSLQVCIHILPEPSKVSSQAIAGGYWRHSWALDPPQVCFRLCIPFCHLLHIWSLVSLGAIFPLDFPWLSRDMKTSNLLLSNTGILKVDRCVLLIS